MEEIYDHEKVNKAIGKVIDKCHKMGLNLLETKKACEAVAVACNELMRKNLQSEAPEEQGPRSPLE